MAASEAGSPAAGDPAAAGALPAAAAGASGSANWLSAMRARAPAMMSSLTSAKPYHAMTATPSKPAMMLKTRATMPRAVKLEPESAC